MIMSTFSKKILKLLVIIEAIILFLCLAFFSEIFPVIFVLGILFFGGFAGILYIMDWLTKE